MRILRRIRFSLRTLCVIVLAVALAFAWLLATSRELDRQLEIVHGINGSADVRGLSVRMVGFADPSTVTNADVGQLATCADLEELYLPGALVDDDVAKSIEQMRQLRVLVLERTGVSDASLSTIGALPRLEELSLSGCPITDAGCTSLAGLTRLKTLRLFDTNVTDVAAAQLATMNQLQELTIARTYISERGMALLSKSLPNCRIIFWEGHVKGVERSSFISSSPCQGNGPSPADRPAHRSATGNQDVHSEGVANR